MIYWATPLQHVLCPMVGVSMQMAGDNTSRPSNLPLATYPTSSPQQLASDHKRWSLLLKAKWFLGDMGHGAIPNSTNRVIHAQLLGRSGQKRLQSQTGVSRNRAHRYSITYLWLRGQIHLIRMCFSLLIYKWWPDFWLGSATYKFRIVNLLSSLEHHCYCY